MSLWNDIGIDNQIFAETTSAGSVLQKKNKPDLISGDGYEYRSYNGCNQRILAAAIVIFMFLLF